MGKTGDKLSDVLDISREMWREYEWVYDGVLRTYTIYNPEMLFLREGGTTHRVVDSHGVAHCAPSVGVFGCVVRWKNKDINNPVNF